MLLLRSLRWEVVIPGFAVKPLIAQEGASVPSLLARVKMNEPFTVKHYAAEALKTLTGLRRGFLKPNADNIKQMGEIFSRTCNFTSDYPLSLVLDFLKGLPRTGQTRLIGEAAFEAPAWYGVDDGIERVRVIWKRDWVSERASFFFDNNHLQSLQNTRQKSLSAEVTSEGLWALGAWFVAAGFARKDVDAIHFEIYAVAGDVLLHGIQALDASEVSKENLPWLLAQAKRSGIQVHGVGNRFEQGA